MPLEIERKFLIQGDFHPQTLDAYEIAQGYLCRDPQRTVRVRIRDSLAFITIKGPTDASGCSRFEWEKQIPVSDARALLKLCLPNVIEKTRYLAPFQNHTFEIDVFHGAHEGLIIAEIELQSPDEPFPHPPWLGPEITGNPRYYNSTLSNPDKSMHNA